MNVEASNFSEVMEFSSRIGEEQRRKIMGEWHNPADDPQEIKLKPTQRGFLRGNFTDTYGSQCSIQESSSATPRLWLGVSTCFQGKESTRMHLSQEQARALLPHLQAFAKYGKLIKEW